MLSVVITHILGAPSAAGSMEHLCCLGTCQKCGVYIPVWLQNQNLHFDKVLRELMCTLEWRRKAPSDPWVTLVGPVHLEDVTGFLGDSVHTFTPSHIHSAVLFEDF